MDYYQNLYFAIDKLIENGEDADVIFDNIIDHLAYRAEDYQSKANSFSSLLNLTRNDDPVGSVPHEPSWKSVFDDMDDINKAYMSESADKFMNFVKNLDFGNDK